MNSIPMCKFCDEYEVGSGRNGDSEFCSEYCRDRAHEYLMDAGDDGEPEGSHDLSDDADVLASAGWGTDEDYGYYGDDY